MSIEYDHQSSDFITLNEACRQKNKEMFKKLFKKFDSDFHVDIVECASDYNFPYGVSVVVNFHLENYDWIISPRNNSDPYLLKTVKEDIENISSLLEQMYVVAINQAASNIIQRALRKVLSKVD
jgi:hypothetical protein